MRILKHDIDIIKDVISSHIKDPKILLFGSRLYDEKKGGDIDILVQTNQNITLKEQIKILAQIELKGVSRKVDLLFQTPYTKEQNIFQTALKEGVVL